MEVEGEEAEADLAKEDQGNSEKEDASCVERKAISKEIVHMFDVEDHQ